MNFPIDGDEQCLDTSIFFQELEDLPKQQSSLGEYRQLSLWKLTQTHKPSSDRISQTSPSTATSETITPDTENSTLLQWGFPVREHQTLESELDCLTPLQHFGEKELDVLLKLDPDSVLSNNHQELSDEDFKLFLATSIWQDTLGKLSLSRRQALGLSTKDSDCLLFPTLTSNESSTSRPAGQTKCEKWFKDNGLIAPGYQLSAEAMALVMGFPVDWFNPLCQSQLTPQDELEPDTSREEPSHQDKQRSPSALASTSTQLLGGDEKLLEPQGGGTFNLLQKDFYFLFHQTTQTTRT